MADEPIVQPLDYQGPPRSGGKRKPPDTPESRRWRFRRMLFRAGLGALFAAIAFYFGPNVVKFRKLTGLSTADFVPDVNDSCRQVVIAMKAYQRDTGSLPYQMDDLTPKYLPMSFKKRGRVMVFNGELSCWSREMEVISYDFTPGTEAWNVSGPFVSGVIPTPPVGATPATQVGR